MSFSKKERKKTVWTRISDRAALELSGGVPFLTFDALAGEPGICHGFSTRLGGVSRGIYASMNLGFARGDSDENVRENYRLLCDALGIPAERLVFSKQTHKDRVRKVTAEDCGTGILRPVFYDDVDAHMTNEPNVPLLIFSADCVPVFFYDKTNGAIALAHAGWRGTVQKIAAKTVAAMEREYGTRPEGLAVVIGPSICRGCFEIGPEVAEEFLRVWPEAEARGLLRKGSGDRYFADLWGANRLALLEAGVPDERISVSGVCTMCRQELFFSHRGSKGRRGSNAGFLMLKG